MMRLFRLILCGAALVSGPAAAAPPERSPASADTLKERLSDKASDEQRVDNCHVPPEKRGPKPRPDCPPPQGRAGKEKPASPASQR